VLSIKCSYLYERRIDKMKKQSKAECIQLIESYLTNESVSISEVGMSGTLSCARNTFKQLLEILENSK
jgi:hypothetical protein